MHYVGVDVAKASLEAADASGKRTRSFPNTARGAAGLVRWCAMWSGADMHIVLEPTSTYHHNLWAYLAETGTPFTVINPARTKSYATFLGRRAKTDRVDAQLLAQMGRSQQPGPSPAPDESQERLRALRRHIEWLSKEIQAAENRLHSAERSPLVPESIEESLKGVIAELEQARDKTEQEAREMVCQDLRLSSASQLLQTIPGIGEKTAMLILAEMPRAGDCASSRSWTAFAGLCPQEVQSGSSSYSRLSRRGSARVRSGIYLAAVVALTYNPPVRAMKERMEARGKKGKLIAVAAMAKLLRICFGVLKSKRPFDPTLHLKQAAQA